jgi:hypothetical protein
MSSKMDEAVYECRLCTDLYNVPHPGLAHKDKEDEDSLQAVDGIEQDNLPTCQFFFIFFLEYILFFITVLTLTMAKSQSKKVLNMCLCKKTFLSSLTYMDGDCVCHCKNHPRKKA